MEVVSFCGIKIFIKFTVTIHVGTDDTLRSMSENGSTELPNNVIEIARSGQSNNIGKFQLPNLNK